MMIDKTLNFIHFVLKRLIVIVGLMLIAINAQGQPVPSPEENIPWLVTFGKKADTSWGDNDFSQIWFFIVPETYKGQVFIRVFDPDTGGANDEVKGVFDTKMRYSIYGGKDAYSHPDAQEVNPKKNFKTGTLLDSKIFGADPNYDNKWYSFGPFAPTQGEYYPKYSGYIFKVVCEGIEGDDGNMYRYFMSTSGSSNIPIEGGNAFTHEYTFRLHDNVNEISHIYPYVDPESTKIQVKNFDWDDDGTIRVISEVRREQKIPVSGENTWATEEFAVYEEEKGKSLDIQFFKRKSPVVKNNNVVIIVRNQRGDLLKFWASPIGGIPKYKYGIEVQKKTK